MLGEQPQQLMSDYLRASFQEDADSFENGSRIVLEAEISHHIQTSRPLFLSHDPNKNIICWLRSRYEGCVLCNADGTLHEAARFLVKSYLKQQKYASPGDNYFNHSAHGVKTERTLQANFLQRADTLGVGVTIPSPYADIVLKTDLILEMQSSGKKRKIGIQITTNSSQKDHKFQIIKQLYSGHNGTYIPTHYGVDDICLLYLGDGNYNFYSICEEFVRSWSDFCQKGDRDFVYQLPFGEIHIYSLKNGKNDGNLRSIHAQTVTSVGELLSPGIIEQTNSGGFVLPFSPRDFSVLQGVVLDTVSLSALPGTRGEGQILSYFDDEMDSSYFPGLIKIIKKWSKKGWMLLEKKDKTRPLQGRMSFDDYKKIRCLLLVNSLDMPKRDQKLQEIVDILEPWFPGIYECIDCFMCFGGTADQKKRLLGYKKLSPINNAASTVSTITPPVNPELLAKKEAREEKRRAASFAHKARMEEEQATFKKRFLAALDVDAEIQKDTEYGKMVRIVVQKLKRDFPIKDKMSLKYVQKVENAMKAIMVVYKRCTQLEKEEDGLQKILEYLNDFINRFGDGAK